MSLGKTAVGIVVIAMVAGGAYYFVHERSARAERVVPVAPVAPVSAPAEAPAPPLPSAAVAASPRGCAIGQRVRRLRRLLAAGDPGLPLKGGEVLDFTADVAKVSNVATLELQTVEKRNFLGRMRGTCRRLRTRRIRCGWCSSSTISLIRTAMLRR